MRPFVTTRAEGEHEDLTPRGHTYCMLYIYIRTRFVFDDVRDGCLVFCACVVSAGVFSTFAVCKTVPFPKSTFIIKPVARHLVVSSQVCIGVAMSNVWTLLVLRTALPKDLRICNLSSRSTGSSSMLGAISCMNTPDSTKLGRPTHA